MMKTLQDVNITPELKAKLEAAGYEIVLSNVPTD
jgi:hypothetical protein